MHHDLLAQKLACPALEILSKIGPVDEKRRQQRGKQRHHQKAAERYQNASEHQCHSLDFGRRVTQFAVVASRKVL